MGLRHQLFHSFYFNLRGQSQLLFLIHFIHKVTDFAGVVVLQILKFGLEFLMLCPEVIEHSLAHSVRFQFINLSLQLFYQFVYLYTGGGADVRWGCWKMGNFPIY